MPDSNISQLDHALSRWNNGDLKGYLDLYSPPIRLHGYTPEPMDRTAIASFYETVWSSLGAAGKPNPIIDLHESFESDGRVACRFTMSGVHRGAFLNAPASGRSYSIPAMTILHFRDGKAVERRSAVDMLNLLTQISGS